MTKDFQWSGPPRYVCPRHGDQGAFIGMTVTLHGVNGTPLPPSLESRKERRYCMACWIDMMDANCMPLAKAKT